MISTSRYRKAFSAYRRPFRGCRWETFYIFAYWGLVGTPHLPAKIQVFAPLPTSMKFLLVLMIVASASSGEESLTQDSFADIFWVFENQFCDIPFFPHESRQGA